MFSLHMGFVSMMVRVPANFRMCRETIVGRPGASYSSDRLLATHLAVWFSNPNHTVSVFQSLVNKN